MICTDHRAFAYASTPSRFPIVLDTRHALKGIGGDNVFRLSIGDR